ncbi:MAG: hypothetical protein ABSA75_03430 [Candidatus Bathyarchaeia archaeon]|jgi:hypothetical protein
MSGNKEKIETVDINLKIKVPMQMYKFLDGLGKLTEKSAEEMLTEEVYILLKDFISGGFAEGWMEYATQQSLDHKLENLTEQVYEEMYGK